VKDAAEATLEGDVGPRVTGGAIRYRIWPVKRYPWRSALVLLALVGATAAAAALLSNAYWAVVVFVGLTIASAPVFFPTEVALDGESLNRRRLGTPRIWKLSEFRRMEVSHDLVPHVELFRSDHLNPVDKVKSVVVPLPVEREVADAVVLHLRRWVGRHPTGQFSLDVDLVPEDGLDGE
jgi:hypothetical protein